MGNSHVRFLGEGVVATLHPYPITLCINARASEISSLCSSRDEELRGPCQLGHKVRIFDFDFRDVDFASRAEPWGVAPAQTALSFVGRL